MTCISNLVPSQFRGPAQVGMGVCLVTAVAVSLIGALGLAQIPLLNALSQSACIALCASGGGFSLLLAVALVSLISSRKAPLTNLQDSVRTASHQSRPANASHDSGPPNLQEVESSASLELLSPTTSHEFDPHSLQKKSSRIGKNAHEETLPSSSELVSADVDSSQENAAVETDDPFREVFKNVFLQKYFFEERIASFSSLILLSGAHKYIRKPFTSWPNWRVKILQRLLFNRTLNIVKPFIQTDSATDRSIVDHLLSDIIEQQTKSDTKAALGSAESIADAVARDGAISVVAKQEAKSNVTAALQLAHSINSTDYRGRAFCAIAKEQAKSDVKSALQTLASLDNSFVSGSASSMDIVSILNSSDIESAFCAVVTEQAKSDVRRAIQTAQSIKIASIRDRAFCAIAKEGAKSDVEAALECVEYIGDIDIRIEALVDIVKEQAKCDFNWAYNTATSFKDTRIRGSALNAIIDRLVDNDEKAALQIAESLKGSEHHAWLLCRIAIEQAKINVETALQTLESVENARCRARAFCIIGVGLAKRDKSPTMISDIFQMAVQTAKSLEDSSDRSFWLTIIVKNQAKSDVKAALQTAQTIEDNSSRASALRAIAKKLAKSDVEAALQLVASIDNDSFAHHGAICDIVKVQARSDVNATLETARSIEQCLTRNSALESIALEQVKTDIEGAVITTNLIDNLPQRTRVLSLIASHCKVTNLPSVQNDKVIEGYFHLVNGP